MLLVEILNTSSAIQPAVLRVEKMRHSVQAQMITKERNVLFRGRKVFTVKHDLV